MGFSSEILTALGSAVKRFESSGITGPLGLKSVTGAKKGIGISGLANKLESQGIKLTDDIFSKGEKEISAFFDDAVDQYYRRGQNELQSKIEENLQRKLSDKELNIFRTSTKNQGLLDKDLSAWMEKQDAPTTLVEDWGNYFRNKSVPDSTINKNTVVQTAPKVNTSSNIIQQEPINTGQTIATDIPKRSHSRKARNLEKYNRDSTYIPKKPELDAQTAAIQNEAMAKDYENLMGKEEPAMQHSRKAQQAERFNKQLSEIKEETKRYNKSRKYYNKPKPETGTEANASFGSVGRAALGTAVGGAALMAALSGSRGQQNNAQLYGQQPLY